MSPCVTVGVVWGAGGVCYHCLEPLGLQSSGWWAGFVRWPVEVACVRLFQCCCVVGAVIVGMAAQSKDWLMQAACYWQQSVAAEGAAIVRPFMSVDLRT